MTGSASALEAARAYHSFTNAGPDAVPPEDAPAVLAFDGIADIAVLVDGSAEDEARLVFAERLAVAAGAHVTAFQANLIPLSVLAEPGSEAIVAEIWKTGAETGDKIGARLRERLDRFDVPTELRRFDATMGQLCVSASHVGRSVDLFVFSRPCGEARLWPDVLEAVLLGAGCATLILPTAPAQARDPRTILVGYSETPECARAIAAALPLLKAAGHVFLVSIAGRSADEEHREEPLADMARHLVRHGVVVEVRHVPHGHRAGEGLLWEAASVGADLIVAGAYGHSRLRELVWGGVTIDLLTKSPLPLLLCH